MIMDVSDIERSSSAGVVHGIVVGEVPAVKESRTTAMKFLCSGVSAALLDLSRSIPSSPESLFPIH